LLLGVTVCGDNTPSAVTYGGQAMTSLDTIYQGGAAGCDVRVRLYYLISPPSGSNTVSISWAGARSGAAVAVGVTGVDVASPFGTQAKASGNGGTPTVNVTSESSQVVVDIMGTNNPVGPSPGAGQTLINSGVCDTGIGRNNTFGGMSYEAGATTVTMSWSSSGADTNWGIIAVPVKPAPAARVRAVEYYTDFWEPMANMRDNNGVDVPPNEVRVDRWVQAHGYSPADPTVFTSFVQDPTKTRIVERSTIGNQLTIRPSKSEFADLVLKRASAGV
jgi:hypothetical protein